MDYEKECRCHTCGRDFHSLGIARHRAMHRKRNEDCTITFSSGITYEYLYSNHEVHKDEK